MFKGHSCFDIESAGQLHLVVMGGAVFQDVWGSAIKLHFPLVCSPADVDVLAE